MNDVQTPGPRADDQHRVSGSSTRSTWTPSAGWLAWRRRERRAGAPLADICAISEGESRAGIAAGCCDTVDPAEDVCTLQRRDG